MLMRLISFCWLVLCLTLSPATSIQAGEVDIAGSTLTLSLGEYVSYLTLPAGTGTPEALLKPEQSQRFSRSRHPVLRFGYGEEEIWMELNLRNLEANARDIIISLDMPNLESVEFYSASHNAALYNTASYNNASYNNSSGPIQHHTRLNFPTPSAQIPLAAHGTTQTLIRVQSRSLRTFSMAAQDRNTFYGSQSVRLATAGLNVGTLLLATVLMLIVYYRLRDPLYVLISLLCLSLGLFIAFNEGFPPLVALVPAGTRTTLEMLMFVAYMAFECHFTRLFLDLKTTHPRLHRTMGWGTYTCLFLILFLPFQQIALFNQISLMLAFVLVPIQLTATLIRWNENYAPIRWMLLSRGMIVIVCIVFLISTVTRLPLASTFFNECLWLLTLEALFLLPALLDRQRLHLQQQQSKSHRVAVAEAETRAKNEFLTQLSHEIRTPMNGILGMTELLEETPLSPTQLDYVKTIASSGNNLLSIIDDILDYSKIEAGKMALDVSIFDLATMLNECLEMFKLRAEEKSLELVSLINSDVPAQVKGDPVRIRQVVANLVSNAIKFTEHGDVLITLSKDSALSARHIRFEVRDTGAGIPKEKLKQLLEGQDQEDKSGAGLGLAIAQQLVKMMGGQLGGSSQPGRGSSFWFSIPLEAVAEDSSNSPFFTEQLQGLRMLVVDDNASCRLVIQQQAASWGMQVTTAVNGKQAMALLRTQANLDEPFDVVILDHDMPGMNGLELAAKLKEDPLINNNLLVLMLTGHSIAPTATAARNAGVRRIITKPVTGRILKITLAEELGHLRKIQANAQPPNEQDLVQLSQLRILIAEDHPLSQKVINGMMHRLDVNSHLVVNGVQAVEEARKGNYDLILMDCDMPEMDGFEATRRIRQWETQNKRTEIPIIALTAHIMDEHKERSLACGMNAHLSKPVELSELRDTMLRWVSSTRPAKENTSKPGNAADITSRKQS